MKIRTIIIVGLLAAGSIAATAPAIAHGPGGDFGGGPCGHDSIEPCDDNGHGTHTMGTAVGGDGGSNRIGMAPGAKWIGCRNMAAGVGTPASYLECFEFFLAPYPVGGAPGDGDPTMAPDVTNNSWGCPASEGCSRETLRAAVEAQRAAGIMTVVSAGNDGPNCSKIADPPAIYDASYTVGALKKGEDAIASFSSRGPVTADGTEIVKPDICAPGTAIRSSVRGGGYQSMQGTSMAGPHVAGAVALLWSARPELRRRIDETEDALNAAAVHIPSTACSSSGVPNNVFGYGRLDVRAAVGDPPTAVPTASPAPTPPPTAVPTSTVTPDPTPSPFHPEEIVLNAVSFEEGETLTAEFVLRRDIARPFAAYAAIVLPDSSTVDAATLGPVRPVAAFMPALGAPFSRTLISRPVPPGAPAGRYEIVAAFFDPYAPVTDRRDAFLEASAAFETR